MNLKEYKERQSKEELSYDEEIERFCKCFNENENLRKENTYLKKNIVKCIKTASEMNLKLVNMMLSN